MKTLLLIFIVSCSSYSQRGYKISNYKNKDKAPNRFSYISEYKENAAPFEHCFEKFNPKSTEWCPSFSAEMITPCELGTGSHNGIPITSRNCSKGEADLKYLIETKTPLRTKLMVKNKLFYIYTFYLPEPEGIFYVIQKNKYLNTKKEFTSFKELEKFIFNNMRNYDQ